MMLFMIFLMSLAGLATCEPPVQGYNYQAPAANFNAPSNAYLPPSTGYGTPSNNYLPPTSHGNDGNHGTQGHGSNLGHGSNSGHGSNTHDYNQGQNHHGHGSEHHVPKSYEFGYSVKDAHSGNDYDRKEVSDGNVVRGEYRVQLPDGRTQIVTYHADWQTGFHADVRYEGEARYPEPVANTRQQAGYHYNAPSFTGSLTGFQGSNYKPSTAYGPPGYH